MNSTNKTPSNSQPSVSIESLLAQVFKMESVAKELDKQVTHTQALFSLTNKEILELLSIKGELV